MGAPAWAASPPSTRPILAITGGAKLRALAIDFERAKFRRIVGRHWQSWDRIVRWGYILRKYALEPRSLLERIRYGSIYDLIEKLPKSAKP